MKRYQCIKNYRIGTTLEFTAGLVYPSLDAYGDYTTFRSNNSPRHSVNGRILREHFQELQDFNVDDHEEEQYTALLPSEKAIGTGCAICIAAILTVFITLLSLL